MLNFLRLVISPPDSSVLYAGNYDPLLVGLSVAIAVFASYACLLASRRVSTAATATARRLWTAGGGLCLGVGIWAMHFVGMLAFSLPCSSSYDATITLLSGIPGILASILALKIISRREISRSQLATGGLLIGAGIGAMHYSGMAAMRLNGLIRYDIKLFLLSILVAIVLATFALWIKFRLQAWRQHRDTQVTVTSAVVMGVAVSGMHYTAMAATYFVRDGDTTIAAAGITPAFLASIVLTVTSLLVVITVVATYAGKSNLSSLRRSYKMIGLFIIGLGISAWLATDYYYIRRADDLYRRESQLARQQAENIAGSIDDSIAMLKGVSQMYSRDVDVLQTLRLFGAEAAPSDSAYEEPKQLWTRDKRLGKLNNSLRDEAPFLGADLIFVINAAGVAVAASNAGTPGSPVGTKYADRDYFPVVQAGRQGRQYAMGRTTHVAGLYFASPVLEAGRFLGAVIVKRDVAKLTRWTNQAGAFATDANGVIILASDKRLEFRTMPNAPVSKLSTEQLLLQYTQSALAPLQMTSWENTRFPSAFFIDGNTSPTLIASRDLAKDGIAIHVPRALDEIVRLGAEKYWIFLLITAVGSMLIVAVSAAVIYLRESLRAAADLRVAASAFEIQEGMLITDGNVAILRVNKTFTDITGYTAEEVIGKNPNVLSSGRQDAGFYAAMWEKIKRAGTWEGEIWNRRKNGEIYPEYLTITAVRDGAGLVTNYVASFADFTRRKAAEEEIRNLAFYDHLTGLPNRRLLIDRLKHALASCLRSGREGALLLIDLDNFKTLNDTLGHDIGDLLLKQVAHRLESCVREEDTAARIGGDEFVVMLESLSTETMGAAAQAKLIGEKIRARLGQPYLLGSHEYNNTPSIGATLFSGRQQVVDELFKQADIAMYQAKKAGRNALRFFDPNMQDAINARAALEGELRKAIENRQFQLHYQIQVDDTRRPVGAETLIRWIHPERGTVFPAQFIPLAEETGLILPIGHWVLETACAQIKAWKQDAAFRDIALAVNVSAKQFRQADFVAQVQSAVRHYGINPNLLKLELTETMLLENIEDIIATMNALKETGICFSLDDFGTGYSSLQYLKRLPISQLKIDQTFVRDITFDGSDESIVGAIIAMARNLDVEVIAEGVETEEQRQLLLNKGCTRFQGHLFGKPVPLARFEALLKLA
jgi:diguanylate cyclase (GGDEF)-like protein/PAS domain S-box-containing protein